MLRRAVITVVAGLLACCLSAAPATAQVHIDFGVGHGHGHYHHHHHGWHGYGYGWYPSYWYNPPVEYVYVTPPPPRVITYAQPTPALQQAQLAPTTATANVAPRPASRSNPLPTDKSRGVTIRNPSSTGGSVAFAVDGQSEWELEPGETKSLNDKATYTVEFDRGEDFGTAEKQVTAGEYEFVVTDSGWDLKQIDKSKWRSALAPTVRKNSLPGTRR